MGATVVPARDNLTWRIHAAAASVNECSSYIPHENYSVLPDAEHAECRESRIGTHGPN